MRLDVIKEKLANIISDTSLTVYSVKIKREFGEKILEILIKGQNINVDQLEEIHLKLVDNLEDGDLDDDYFLELSSLGAEYPLSNLEEVKEHINSYVLVKTNHFQLIGYIIEVDGETITFEYNDKGQFRKKKIEYDEISSIETRVKV